MATRIASEGAINAIAEVMPEFWGGSADLAGSTNTTIKGADSFLPEAHGGSPYGRVLHFGIREHAMGAILNGITLHGGTRVFGATFLTFSDYKRGAIRLSALMGIPVTYVWTHDSIGLGEDGPTHQPVEQLASLRALPGFDVVRPADATETTIAWRTILEHTDRPAGLVLTRQKLPVIDRSTYPSAEGVAQGAYILAEAGSGTPKVILIATGSEVSAGARGARTARGRGHAHPGRLDAVPRVVRGAGSRRTGSRCCRPRSARGCPSRPPSRWAGATSSATTASRSRSSTSAPARRTDPVRAVRHHSGPHRRGRARQPVQGRRDLRLHHRQLRSTPCPIPSRTSPRRASPSGSTTSRESGSSPAAWPTLARDSHVVGVTTNPTIFQKAISGSETYDEQIRDLARRGVDVGEALRAITTYDVRWGCDVLRPAYDASDGIDGRVSIEVDPRLAHETERTVAEARALWWLVDRPNSFIKIPATPEGVPAIAQALAEGISVNVTLIFSLERYAEVIEAFFTGLERARAAGHDLSRLGSVASFFISRVDTEVDKRLDKIGSDEAKALRGKAAVANARLAYKLYEQKFDSDRWRALAAAGAKPQRPLWASTSTKDPAYADTMYVDDLIAKGRGQHDARGDDARDVADHGVMTGDTVTTHYVEAQQVLDELAEVGIDYDDVVQVLEDEGVEKFDASWSELIDSIQGELDKLAKQVNTSGPAAGSKK